MKGPPMLRPKLNLTAWIGKALEGRKRADTRRNRYAMRPVVEQGERRLLLSRALFTPTVGSAPSLRSTNRFPFLLAPNRDAGPPVAKPVGLPGVDLGQPILQKARSLDRDAHAQIVKPIHVHADAISPAWSSSNLDVRHAFPVHRPGVYHGRHFIGR